MAQPSLPDTGPAGSTLELAEGRSTESLARAHGATFLVTTQMGDVAPRGAREFGFFDHDTRFLSHYELEIRGMHVAYLSAESAGEMANQIDLMLSGCDDQEFLDDPKNYVHIRRRQLLDEGMAEEITFTNYLHRELRFEMRVAFAADFADIFEVRGATRARRGTSRRPVLGPDHVELRYDGLDGEAYATHIAFAPAPTKLTGEGACFEVVLAPRERRRFQVWVRAERGAAAPSERGADERRFTARVRRLADEAQAFQEACTHFRTDNGMIQHALDRAGSDLFALRTTFGEHAILAAGIPWFCCPFGRDALLASYESLMLDPELAAASLRALAAFQGTKDDPFTEEEPGKILHELRFGEMARAGETPHSPYYGSIDATPLFVVVAHATWEVTADAALVRELGPAVRAALAWIDRHTEQGKRPLTYQRKSPRGLDNQGWKDSKDAVVFADGRRAEPPIALIEVQGYCVDAYARGAALLEVLGDDALAGTYVARSHKMREIVENELWLEDRGRYAFALDGRGRKLDTVVSNLGHLLWSRAITPARALATTELLLSSESFSGFGVRTLAAGQGAFNPLSYHNGTVWPHDNAILARGMSFYGLSGPAVCVFEGLGRALDVFRDRRLPELFCGMSADSGLARYPVACNPQAWAAAAPFLLLQSVFGLFFDAPNGRLFVRDPVLPPSLREVTLENLRVGSARVDLRFRRDGRRCHVDVLDITGGHVRTSIELS